MNRFYLGFLDCLLTSICLLVSVRLLASVIISRLLASVRLLASSFICSRPPTRVAYLLQSACSVAVVDTCLRHPRRPQYAYPDLQDRVAEAKDDCKEMISIRKEIVDFHGEMVLLENYSALNYTGLGKILKKYDKRTGALIRLPFIQKVLQQPFCNTVLLYKLVKECEAMLDQLFPVNPPPTTTEISNEAGEDSAPSTCSITKIDPLLTDPKELAEIKYMQSLHMKSAISALRVLKDIRKGSSTVSVFSLPPLQIGGLDEPWKKPSPIMEEVAE